MSEAPKHTTESRDDRRKQRELAEARQAGEYCHASFVVWFQPFCPLVALTLFPFYDLSRYGCSCNRC